MEGTGIESEREVVLELGFKVSSENFSWFVKSWNRLSDKMAISKMST